MAHLPQSVLDGFKAVDEATNEVGAEVTRLRGQVKEGMTAESVAEVRAGLDGLAVRLKAIGADPNNPAPE